MKHLTVGAKHGDIISPYAKESVRIVFILT